MLGRSAAWATPCAGPSFNRAGNAPCWDQHAQRGPLGTRLNEAIRTDACIMAVLFYVTPHVLFPLEPTMIHAYHVVFGTYGFWLPNDPRGFWSDFVGAWELLPFGDATKGLERLELTRRAK
jgi:hypothetical protein